MPLIHVLTSAAPLPETEEAALHKELSRLLTAELGKPERWIMTAVRPGASMTFAGTRAPACLATVKNVGTMTADTTAALSRALCAALSRALSLPADRIYIDFQNAEPHLWGWNGEVF
jgi:phenylpyruvate tautomerase